jgi:hypothetical protein
MRTRLLCAAAAAALAAAPGILVAPAAPAHAGPALRLAADGVLTPTEPGPATGTFVLRSAVRPSGLESVHVQVVLLDVDGTPDASGARPVLEVVLVTADGAAVADLGPVRVNRRARARLRLRDAAPRLPPGAPALRDFVGGTLEVRRGDESVLLSAPVPPLAMLGVDRSLSTRRVSGDLVGVDRPRRSPGHFVLDATRRGTGVHVNRVVVVSPRLSSVPNAAGQKPDYRVWLVNQAGNRQVDLGTMELELRYGAWLRRDSRLAPLPGNIVTLEEFGDGRLEVRQGSVVRLRGHVLPFRGVDEPGILGRSALARGTEELGATGEGGAARGLVRAAVVVWPERRVERFGVRVVGLDSARSPYALTAVHVSGTRTELGSFASHSGRGPFSAGRLSVSTRRRQALPGGSVLWLSGQSLEVRDAAGALVLTGTFPTLE